MHDNEIERYSKFLLITSQTVNLLLLFAVTGAQGHITESPKNRIVLKGATNVFTCCSDIPETHFWKHKAIGSTIAKEIYDSKGLANGFLTSGRFNVTSGSSHGCQSLSSINVRLEDAGTYTCIDKAGQGQTVAWELVVIDSFDCQEVNSKAEYMGANDFGLQQDVISAKCISKYRGHIHPKPTCEWSSETQKLDNYHSVVETNLTTTLDINIPARKEFNGYQLSCYANIAEESRAKEIPTTWKSSNFKINYASLRQNDVSQCSREELYLDCQPQCQYNPGKFSNDSPYCEVTYPTKTHPKLFVRLQDKNLEKLEQEWRVSEKEEFIMTAVFAGIACMAFGVLVEKIFCYLRKKARLPPRSSRTISTIECGEARCPQRSSRSIATIEYCETIHQIANGKQRTDDPVNENASPEKKSMLAGTRGELEKC